MRNTISVYSLVTAAALTLGTTTAVRAAGDHEGGHAHEEGRSAHTHGFAFGQPAGEAEPDRTVRISATDSMDFDPAEIQVATGEVVRFVVENTGSMNHSFTIGPDEWHRKHEKEMQNVPQDELISHMKDEPNGTVIPPGETRSLTWVFEKEGAVRIGCHIPGHYPAGMKGKVDAS